MTLEISSEFRQEMAETHVGATVSYCYQCGTCAGFCPAFRLDNRYNPRRIVEDILLGRGEHLLEDPVIWLCTTCHGCLEVCPQGVLVSEMLFELRNKAASRGNLPGNLRDEGRRVIDTGLNIPPSPAITKRRSGMGLAEVAMAPNLDDVKVLCEELGFTGLIENAEKAAREVASDE
ncbi:MAG: 4Fe-4S dicluster domain-containing protein [Promethearchaeota archaeon]